MSTVLELMEKRKKAWETLPVCRWELEHKGGMYRKRMHRSRVTGI